MDYFVDSDAKCRVPIFKVSLDSLKKPFVCEKS